MLQNIGNYTGEFGTAADLDDINYAYYDIDNESDFAIPFYLCFILTTLYVVIFVTGILGNLLVIIVIIKDVKLRTLAHFYFISLSAADLMIILFCLPVAVYELYSSNWIFGNAICKLTPFLQYLSVNASMLTILAIGVERFVVICLPLKARYYCTKRVTLLTTVGIWFICSFASVPSFIFSAVTVNNVTHPSSTNVTITQCYTQQEEMEWYIMAQTITFYLLPGILLFIIYIFISRSLRNNSTNAEFVPLRSLNAQRAESIRQLHMTLTGVVVAYFFCLLPFNLILVLSIISPMTLLAISSYSLNVLLAFARVLFFFNSCINPILYNAISSKFRAAFCRLFGARGKYGERNQHITSEYGSTPNSYMYIASPRLMKRFTVCENGIVKSTTQTRESII